MSWRNAAELQSETTVPYIVRTSVARRIQLGAVRLLQTKIAEGSDGIMAKLQYNKAFSGSAITLIELSVMALAQATECNPPPLILPVKPHPCART